MLETLTSQGLVSPSAALFGSPCFTIYKTPTKCRLIVDMRVYNMLWPRPPPFCLPSLDTLLNLTLKGLFFIKIDVSNFYWSLSIPDHVTGSFVLCAGTQFYHTRRLPFGWRWSPFLAQETLRRVLQPVSVMLGALLWQFVDDVLFASPDPYFLSFVGSYVVHLLSTAHLFVNDKSVLIPTHHITWLGKFVNSIDGLISNQPHRIAHVLTHLWFLRCVRLTFRALQKLLGMLQWIQAPCSTAAPFLATAYSLLRQTRLPILLPRAIWYSLLNVILLAAQPTQARRLPPPPCMPLVFCDAAPHGSSFLVAVWKRDSFASVTETPSWVTSLQQAELYAIFHCVRLLSLRKLSMACLITDNLGAFYTVATGRVSAYSRTRLRLLCRINRICASSTLQLEIALVPSVHNAADPYSRLFEHHPLSVDAAARSRESLATFTGFSTALKRFWWRF